MLALFRMYFWDSIRWRIFIYYTTLIAAMIALLIGLHAISAKASIEQLEEAGLRAHAIALLPEFFPPPLRGQVPPVDGRIVREPPPPDSPVVRAALESSRSEGWFFLVMTGSGHVLARSENAPGAVARPELWRKAGILEAVPVPGYLAVAAKTPREEYLVVGMPRKTLAAEATRSLLVAIVVGGAVFAAASLLGFGIISHGLQPIARISEAALRISEGELSDRIDVRSQRSELGQLARILNDTFDRLSEALARQVRFTADASHELRTPVASILADCQFVLKKERSPERYRETISFCQESALHMRSLIERLSLLARFDARETVLKKEAADLREIGARALSVVGPLAEESGIVMRSELSPVGVTADPLRIEQVAINLLTNAIRYNKPGGSVTLRTGQAGAKAFLEVEDSGIGIPADKLSRVFDRFFRVDDSRNAGTGGSGLGLAICKSVVEAHGGSLTVESEADSGSKFRLEIPVWEEVSPTGHHHSLGLNI